MKTTQMKPYILALFLLLPSAAIAMRKKTLMVYVEKDKEEARSTYLMEVIDTENSRTTSQLAKLGSGTEYLVKKKYKIVGRGKDYLDAIETDYHMQMGAHIKDHPLKKLMNNKAVQAAIKKAQLAKGWIVVEIEGYGKLGQEKNL